jgi:cyclophilin family peptidyl-prolyl cis-trans isomerase
MAKNQKKSKSAPKESQILFPLMFIAIIAAAVILIIFVTQGSKSDSYTEEGGIDPFATPHLVATKQYSAEPPMLIDSDKVYTATVNMAKGGSFEIELYAEKAPKTVNSFVFLARQGYFDGVTFHRVLEGFMAQGGDPTGTGTGGPGYKFEYEDSGYAFDKAGVVAMANSGPRTATNGSQFFITFGPVPQLDGGYTIFGQVVSGMDVVNGITLRDPQKSPDYEGDVIESITIREE